MSPTIALARAELTMLARNRTAALNAALLPVAGIVLLVAKPPPAGAAATAAGLVLLALVALTMATTVTTTLVARRQAHVLQRWRTAPLATGSVLLGTLAPVAVLLAVQATALFAALGYVTGTVPAHPVLVALAVPLGAALGCAAAFVTAAFTRTVEAANITMLPVLAALLGGGMWALTAGPGEITWAIRATGGGALAELVQLGWSGLGDGAVWAAAGSSVLVLLTLTAAAVAVALRTFRWEPRS